MHGNFFSRKLIYLKNKKQIAILYTTEAAEATIYGDNGTRYEAGLVIIGNDPEYRKEISMMADATIEGFGELPPIC